MDAAVVTIATVLALYCFICRLTEVLEKVSEGYSFSV
jgi:hypothetical protein